VSAHSGEESSTALNGKPEAKVSKVVKQNLSNDRKTGNTEYALSSCSSVTDSHRESLQWR